MSYIISCNGRRNRPCPIFNRFLLFFPVILILFYNCQSRQTGQGKNELVQNNTPKNADTQNHALNLQFAEGFSFKDYGQGTLVNIFNPFNDRGDTLQYILLQEGQSRPPGLKQDVVRINTPVENIIGLSATHIGFLKALGALDVLQGVSDTGYVYNEAVRSGVAEGKVQQVGEDASLNRELVLAMEPDLVMASGFPQGRLKKFSTLQEVGIPVIFNSEWMESTPIARTEWIKLMGVLVDKERLAKQIFDSVVTRYKKLKEKVTSFDQTPKVIVGLPFKDAWFVSGGASYAARFLQDAGARYPWSDNPQKGSLKLDLEAVYPIALEASYWISPGKSTSKSAILDNDSRISDFKAFQNGNIYNNTRKKIASGGNDYWESGVVEPHIVLKDLIRIFHPEMLPDHQLKYYEKVR